MPKINFEIRVTDFNNECFALTVVDTPAFGPELAGTSFPIAKKALEALSRDAAAVLTEVVTSKDDILRAHGSAAEQRLASFGRDLFDLLIWRHGGALAESWGDFAGRTTEARRLRLCLTNAAGTLPWEALRDDHKLNNCPARLFSVVRYVPTSPPLQPVALGADPLRMLVVLADPSGDLTRTSAIEDERKAIESALRPAMDRRDVCVDFIEAGSGRTLDLMKEMIERRQTGSRQAYHLLHYFGHGHSTDQGQLEFEGARRDETVRVGWGQLQRVLAQTSASLRLVVLNACELAQPDQAIVAYSPFANLAGSLLHAGAAMVVAMQYPIRTATATRFTNAFYSYLCPRLFASAEDIEDAVVQGRAAIESEQNAVEWITPVVFSRLSEDPIFCFGLLIEAQRLCGLGLRVEAARKVKEVLAENPFSAEGLRLKQALLDEAAAMIERLDPAGGEIVDALT